jgi:signal transduction histidine kinase
MRRTSPLGRYVRARLHRRLFAWFGATILLTGIIVATLMIVLSNWWGGPEFIREIQRIKHFTGMRFAEVWDSPDKRDALAESISKDLGLGVRLEDTEGRALADFGPTKCQHEVRIPVMRGDDEIGRAAVCLRSMPHSPWGAWKAALVLMVVGGMLWGASGKIARRLARPLADVARVAHEIGRGKLSSRAGLHCGMPDEVGVLAVSINDMADRIERQLSDQRVLLAAVSHELRTPLGHLRILIELIRQNGSDEKTLLELEKEVVEIDALVGELLASSRLDFSALSIKELDAADVGKRALDRAGIPSEKLHVEANGAALMVECDPTLIARALANLIDNAKRHGGGVVALRVKPVSSRVAFEVDDQGSGISEGDQERVFEPFYQSKNGGENGALGLGLALVKRIAEAHRGAAYAGARPGGGARIGFEIPQKSAINSSGA